MANPINISPATFNFAQMNFTSLKMNPDGLNAAICMAIQPFKSRQFCFAIFKS